MWQLDMKNTCDKLEWSFIRKCLYDLGFCNMWVNWIMKCLTTATLTMLVNRKPGNAFVPEGGIWQGDLISPHTFYLWRISRQIQSFYVDSKKSRIWIKIVKDSPNISSLMFAYDCWLFRRPTKHITRKVNTYSGTL